MRQFVKLSDLQDEFQAIGVNVGGMTYDQAETIQQFHTEWQLTYPLLQDVDGKHVNAWGIRNEEYGPGTFAYGIPHPGVVLMSPEGAILAKWAEAGYRSRADWKTVLREVRTLVGGG